LKTLLVVGIVLFFAVSLVMAVFFRDEKSRSRLRFVRNVGWGYVIAIVLLAVWRISQNGL